MEEERRGQIFPSKIKDWKIIDNLREDIQFYKNWCMKKKKKNHSDQFVSFSSENLAPSVLSMNISFLLLPILSLLSFLKL